MIHYCDDVAVDFLERKGFPKCPLRSRKRGWRFGCPSRQALWEKAKTTKCMEKQNRSLLAEASTKSAETTSRAKMRARRVAIVRDVGR